MGGPCPPRDGSQLGLAEVPQIPVPVVSRLKHGGKAWGFWEGSLTLLFWRYLWSGLVLIPLSFSSGCLPSFRAV